MKNLIKKITFLVLIGIIMFNGPGQADDKKLYVITSSSTLADFVKQVGGTKVEVESLARGTQDIHYIEPRPSFVSKLRQADLVVLNGLAFDIWMLPLIEAARNPNIMTGGKGYVEASAGVRALEIPPGKVSMAQGELHPLGNPHFLLDPRRAKIAVRNILEGLIRVSPENAQYFRSNYEHYMSSLNEKIMEWSKMISPFKGEPVVTYHKSWTYFIQAFKLVEFGTVEPKPAIPPSPAHISHLIEQMKQHQVKIMLKEPYYPDTFPARIAQETGATLLVLPEWVGGAPGTGTYIAHIDYVVRKIADALKK